MIEGNEYMRVNDLMRSIDHLDVYKHYLGYEPLLRKLYLSPFRPDSNPSFGLFLGTRGDLMYKDFGAEYTGNCIMFVQQLFGIDYRSAINKIVVDLKPDRNNVVIRPVSVREFTRIQIISKPFNADDKAYWGAYGISTDDLKRENVYSVKSLFVNKGVVIVDKLCFAYLFSDDDNEYLKIYQPFGKTKWLSNVPVKKAFGLDSLEKKSNVVVVAKSKKDKLVLKKLITDVYETQKEGTEVITQEVDAYFNQFYDRKVCFFDSDGPGKAANRLLNPLGYGWINVPNKYLSEGIKDPSDLVKAHGYGRLEELLREKGLL